MFNAVGLRCAFRRICQERRSFKTFAGLQKLVQFNLSDIGEGIAEVQIKEWSVEVGDSVDEFDPLCEVQSDKATASITSRFKGVITKLHYNVDDMAKVGKPLVDIDVEDGSGLRLHTFDHSNLQLPDSSSESDVQESRQPASRPEETSRQPVSRQQEQSRQEESSRQNSYILAAPAVRRIAMENKVNLKDIQGSGKDGRVLKEDILRFVGEISMATGPPPSRAPQTKPQMQISTEDRTIPVRGYMRIMVKIMTEANKIPHFGYYDEVCVDRLVELREQLKILATSKGVKMSFMPMFIKAASMALYQYPVLNSVLHSDLENLTYKAEHNISVAMDTPDGLVVPNIKDCGRKNLWDIALELNRLHEDGVKGQVLKEDLVGGTFTLSNIGSIGGTYASPVIMPPQVAIGALGKIMVYPRFSKTGTVEAQRLVKVSWSADHRVIDGATMARFSNVWKEYLENPGLMMADMR